MIVSKPLEMGNILELTRPGRGQKHELALM